MHTDPRPALTFKDLRLVSAEASRQLPPPAPVLGEHLSLDHLPEPGGDPVSARTKWSSELGLLFIDGDHSYGAVRSDFVMYTSFVAEDGMIVLHDIFDYPAALGYGNDVALF